MEFRMTAITAKDNPSIQLYRKLEIGRAHV